MDGTNGSTTFTDSSASAHSVTVNGNAQISTAQSKFGGASGYFDGNGDYISIPASSDFNFGTGDWTIDFWFYAPDQSINYPAMISSSNYNGGGSIRYDNTGHASKVFFYWYAEGDPAVVTSNTINNNTWTHVAIVRYGTSLKIYINGINDGSKAIAAGSAIDFSSGEFRIGRGFDVDGPQAYYTGYIEEVRVSKGIARWTSNFTPPTAPY